MDAMDAYKTSPPPSSAEIVRESNHRIANHLSMIAGMVQMQSSALAKGPDTLSRSSVRAMLQETAGKIVSVCHLHRKLASAPEIDEIDLSSYVVESSEALLSSLALYGRAGIAYQLGDRCAVSPETAQTMSLIASEIIMNAVKHAHPTGVPVVINLNCSHDAEGRMFLDIQDDGVGLPEFFDEKKHSGVGLRLIRSLADQIGARIDIHSDSLGLCFRITLAS